MARGGFRVNKNVIVALGALSGLVSLVAMIRLVAGAGLGSTFAWVFILLAMLPWVGYSAYRAHHGRMTASAALAVLAMCAVGVIGVWLFTFGPVLALACSLAAFVVIWVYDWPPRRERGEDQFVRIEELATDER
jgi:hypothetical protein